jgi:hypothetical protein
MSGTRGSLKSEFVPDASQLFGIDQESKEKSEIPYGYCHCGCGQKVGIYKQTRPLLGIKRGELQKYIHGHNSVGEGGPNWKGGKWERCDGYVFVAVGTHKARLEHLVICEKVLGRPLPIGAMVHHLNENKNDNRNSNLVICQDSAYHLLLHKRMRAFKTCGHYDWEKCQYCKQYSPPSEIAHAKYGGKHHMKCKREWQLCHRHEKGISHAYRRTGGVQCNEDQGHSYNP